ncbi:MAG: hypothetical protein A3I26_03570 [Candidatus Yanofskybacteria bacterium RIFCSPLOWO2_02_FULL_43_10]|uniref:Putative gluconeogenesis factor n=1 Tax=Candidatus Yanofskybacteria bacterium RIFCSPLOWO2_12_FULL_43_11b TaxID=1802710 RepID=A0A1F8H7S7_9BACT|nr:MAG: hypothetical protein A2742_01365 [Candidatus Yanofskybacteria bacterium RIFCSPHIGHO2_01_FULL_43_32]OGN11986.1 MAG: hypothetical protein A3C69_02895 [Candidatus Yanofskybacteria bacterium RIFCSPHIGHO2_02_FULL_43_12]OGN17813.1 MAG: hypothetical protein A3E34_01100 [Candidatus Yanofskybacteria bacterium RIFCSPHIGHO2_12_FULL_43_11]OGN24771.1 MAG: hypothetical protein A2923_03055 [Candidatus Yanofskybacteria bacterium RIFCSPLOWO2_01_FULL_43_46]OGN30297.1 MAG: hypothetical protein A3I26_03570
MTSDKIRVVCFGGGTGLPTLLSGIKANPFFEISAIVTMFDTGGSSGKLKDKFGILPPGDILKCILALSKNEQATREIFLKRITDINYPGHTGGNILLLGLEKVYGSLTTAINALGEILSASGKVYPVTLAKSTLCAEFSDGTTVKGETLIDVGIFEGKAVKKLFLNPSIKANPKALSAIKKADILIMGPGSFYTSLLPNFLPQGVKEAIKESEAKTIYVCNLLTEGYGMKNYKMDTFIKTVESYAGRKIDRVIANSHIPSKRLGEYAAERKYPVKISGKFPKNKIVAANLWTDSNLARHDQKKLSYLIDRVVFSLLNL